MSDRLFDAYLSEAENTQFLGWDFGYFTNSRRMVESPLKWNFYNIVLPYLMNADRLLDMGTGGGEVLSGFAHLPRYTYATEGYPPNIAVAKARLEPLGVKVVEVDGHKYPNNEYLPWEDSFFDIIINRHESFHPPELFRVLKPRALFVSQQVGVGMSRLKKALTNQSAEKSDWGLSKVVGQLDSAGFTIVERYEDVQWIRYYDIGAIAYHLKAIPWIIEGFTIKGYRERLSKIHNQIQKIGFFEDGYSIFLVIAQKPTNT